MRSELQVPVRDCQDDQGCLLTRRNQVHRASLQPHPEQSVAGRFNIRRASHLSVGHKVWQGGSTSEPSISGTLEESEDTRI